MCAASSVCSGVSTAHGPAARVKVSGPMGTRASPTKIVDISGWFWRLTSLYGEEMRITSLTPLMPRRSRVCSSSMSPTRPMIVRLTPRLTKASPPASGDARHHGVDLLTGGVGAHHHDHRWLLVSVSVSGKA